MRRRVVIVSSLVVLAGVGAGLGGVWYLKAQTAEASPVATNSSGGSIALNQGDSNAASTPIDTTPSTEGQSSNSANNPQSSTNNSLKVSQDNQKTSNNSNGSSNVTSDPSLAELAGYETNYKSKDSAFFGDLRAGTGLVAEVGKTLVVNYRGWLTNGQVFDQSYSTSTKQGQPFSFILGKHQVILGWEEGFVGMKVGGKRRIIVPPAVGYGSKEVGGIPANSLLVFDVELLAVQ
jgi:FKBP-type peptidyl-prolyl cis-trans isomerase